MRTISLLLTIVGSLIAFSSCDKTIHGSGNYTDETRIVSTFTAIQTEGDFDVIISQDSIQTLSIHAEDNVLPEIETVVEGGKLIIRYKDYDTNVDDNGVTITITAAQINDLNIQGSGDINATNAFNPSDAKVNISGSGNIDYSVNCQSITTNISGSGNIILKGSSATAEHSISGSGDIHAFDLPCTSAEVTISGSGDCEVNVSDDLTVNHQRKRRCDLHG
jgi:hypothetical protein